MLQDKQLFSKVSFQSTKYRKKELCWDNIKTIGVVYCSTCRNEKGVYISSNKTTSFHVCKNCKACCRVLNNPFKDQKPTIMLFAGDGTHCFARKTSRDYKKPSSFWRNFPANHNQAHPNLNQRRLNWVPTWNKRLRFLLVDDLSDLFIFQVILFNFNLQSTATQHTFKLQKIMIFSVSNDGIQWTLDFGPDSVAIAVNDFDQNITISSQKIPLAAWQLLLFQRQDFLNNHLARVSITPKQEGTIERRDEVLSSVGAQYVDTNSYQASDLEDIEFNWEDSQLDMDAVFRPGIDSPFSPTTFDNLSMRGSVENPIVLDEEQDNEKSPPAPTTPESAEPPRLQRNRPFGTRIENVPDYVYRNLFQ